MYHLWVLCLLFSAGWCLDKGAHEKDLEMCKGPGVLHSPELFLNVSSGHEGDSVFARCKVPANISSIRIFFCKDGCAISVQQEIPQNLLYGFVFSISQQSPGKYSCGYQKKYDNLRKENSLLSATWEITVLPKPTQLSDEFSEPPTGSEHSARPGIRGHVDFQGMPLYVWIIRCLMVLFLLVSPRGFSYILKMWC